MLIAVLSAFLLGAVVYDSLNHRLPNYYLLLGLIIALIMQFFIGGISGVAAAGWGLLGGLALFIPLYASGGMAAGDVKLMAVIGSYIGVPSVFWGGACSLVAGGVMGVLYLIYKGQFGRFLERYWAMASLRRYIHAEDGDAARHRIPYAIAIAVGTLFSLYWTPI